MTPVQPVPEQRYVAALTKLLAGTEAFAPLLADDEICAYRLSPDGTLIAASPALLALLGYPNLAALRAGELDKAAFDAGYAEAMFAQYKGEVLDAETEWRAADGEALAVRESARATYGPAGRPLHYDGVIVPLAGGSLPEGGRAAPLLAAGPAATATPIAGRNPMIFAANSGGRESRAAKPLALRQYVSILWRWAWLIVLCMALAGGAAYVYSIQSTPVYQSSATLLINQARTGNGYNDYNALLTGERLAQTYAELMRKRPVLDAVIANLQLATDADKLADRVSVAPVRNTQLLNLTVEDSDPQRAADIANEIVRVFGQQNQAQQTSRYSDTRQSLERELAKVQADIDSTQASLAGLKNPGTAASDTERERLETLLAQYRSSYATLTKSLGDVRLAEAQSTDSLTVAEAARAEPVPVRPQPLRSAVLAALAGALLAIGCAFLLEFLDDRVKTPEQAGKQAGAMALGAIGKLPAAAEGGQLVALRAANSPMAEAYRMLRVNLDFTAIDSPLRALTISSASPGEGKSTTIANLAVALAEAGRRVIVVDTDMRRPTLHKVFGLPNDRGVTAALLGAADADIHQQLAATELPNLHLMPCGPIPPNPAELLSSRRMAELIEALKAECDIVLFDTPPLLVFADAAQLARACDGTILVARANSTRVGALRQARAQLLQGGARLLGVVLNSVATPRGKQQSYYYYYSSEQERSRRRFGLFGRAKPRRDRNNSLPAARLPGAGAPSNSTGAAEQRNAAVATPRASIQPELAAPNGVLSADTTPAYSNGSARAPKRKRQGA